MTVKLEVAEDGLIPQEFCCAYCLILVVVTLLGAIAEPLTMKQLWLSPNWLAE